MKTIRNFAFGAGLLGALALPGSARADKTFEFTYEVTLKDLPADARSVRVWIPIASSDAAQTVRLKGIASPVRTSETRDPEYSNRILYAEIARPQSATARFALDYEVTRREYSGQPAGEAASTPLSRFLRADGLVPIDGKMQELAEEITRGKQGTREIARAIYDYVFKSLKYDKSGTGWGRGDALWACDAKRGNCTDFHSLFIALMRAKKIPARFEIGFPLPEKAREGEIAGYHCWAEFYVEGEGWVPVDISEAWKAPSRHDYFFGKLDANRIQFTVGRDILLKPRQDGDALNYFIYPYVEVDGKPYAGVEKKFTFREVPASPGVSGGR
jgi:transglutaminase-like putative cysteine protease